MKLLPLAAIVAALALPAAAQSTAKVEPLAPAAQSASHTRAAAPASGKAGASSHRTHAKGTRKTHRKSAAQPASSKG